ncbi:MAG: hypothetical protein IJ776_02660 [Paludibacteraceae bacterium]|nr:hypothetical protein [Paludibacteraceae bacterium]
MKHNFHTKDAAPVITYLILCFALLSCSNHVENEYTEQTIGDGSKQENVEQPYITIDGIEYDNSENRCWEVNIKSDSLSETIFAWNTEYGMEIYCRKIKESYDNISYFYKESAADDSESCINSEYIQSGTDK